MSQGKAASKGKVNKVWTIIKEIVDFIWPYAVAIGIVIILKSYIFILANVPSTSMLNTLQVDDKIYGNRLAYNETDKPERGDIIIFNSPMNDGELFVKRLIGLPGEKVEIREAKVYINDSDTPLEEDYLPNSWAVYNDGLTYYVPEGEYFFMGDNRNASNDSRKWKYPFIKEEDIVARAECVYWPISNWKLLQND